MYVNLSINYVVELLISCGYYCCLSLNKIVSKRDEIVNEKIRTDCAHVHVNYYMHTFVYLVFDLRVLNVG